MQLVDNYTFNKSCMIGYSFKFGVSPLAFLFFLPFCSCSRSNGEDLKRLVSVQQERITALEKANEKISIQLDRIEENQPNAPAISANEVNERFENFEARLDRDENVINRIGHRASDAYNQSSNPYNLR